jgi:hypothetical protein
MTSCLIDPKGVSEESHDHVCVKAVGVVSMAKSNKTALYVDPLPLIGLTADMEY